MSIRERISDWVVKTLDPKRAPIGTQLSWGSGMSLGNYLSTYGTNGWVFACASKIAQAVGEAEPHMYTRNSDGDVEEVYTHPLLDVLSHMTDFHTRQEAFELEQTYLDLCGEWAMLVFRDGFGIKELWPINPNQLSVVPHPTNYLSGYVFAANDGMTKVPLEPKDVLFIRMPNPTSLYRGQGLIQSIITDIEGDRFAAQWNRNFFINGASHGGAIEVPKELTEEAFERLTGQWKQGHQGVANAHRVAILQGGAKWVPPTSALKDMDFPALRRVNRDIILGAFGMSPHMLGAEESSNRASAESSEYVFSRWVVLPRLRRIAGKINEFLLPQFPGSEEMWLEFEDPTPENDEFDLQLAKDGFAAGFLTRNEARELVGADNLGPVGDIFFMGIMSQPQRADEEVVAISPTASPSDAGDTQADEDEESATDEGKTLFGLPIVEGPLFKDGKTPTLVLGQYGKGLSPEVRWDIFVKRLTPMENKFGGWVKGQFAGQKRETLARIRAHQLGGKPVKVKVTSEVYEAAKYAKDLSKGANPFLRAMILAAGEAGAAELGTMFSMSNPRVLEFLGIRTAKFGVYVTDTISRDITSQLKLAYDAGESIPQIAARIENVFDAAENRATLIARTEMVASSNEGAMESYRQSGVVQAKEWQASLDERTREDHMIANGQIVDLEDDFIVGGDRMSAPGIGSDPAQVCNCRCTVAPVVRPDSPLHEVH